MTVKAVFWWKFLRISIDDTYCSVALGLFDKGSYADECRGTSSANGEEGYAPSSAQAFKKPDQNFSSKDRAAIFVYTALIAL